MNEITEIMKFDTRGRVRTSREKQEAILDELERSRMPGRQFARHVGIKYPTLMSWVQRRKREWKNPIGAATDRVKAERPGFQTRQWIEAVVEEGVGDFAVEVEENPSDWRRIGEARTERLDYRAARSFRQVTVRPKYVERDLPEAAAVISELPPSLQERCMAAPGLVAQVVVAKYCDHLPLYRQEQIYQQRHRIWLPRESLSDWVELAAFCKRQPSDHLPLKPEMS